MNVGEEGRSGMDAEGQEGEDSVWGICVSVESLKPITGPLTVPGKGEMGEVYTGLIQRG